MSKLWETLDKDTFSRVLAFVIVIAWLATIFIHVQADQTLTAVVMLVVGYFYGSSIGSKRKDDALVPLPTKDSVTTEMSTTTATSTTEPATVK